MMEALKKGDKRNYFLLMIGYFTFGYLSVNWLTSQQSSFHTLAFNFEYRIPFLAPFVLGYAAVYGAMLLIYLVVKDVSSWRRTVVSFFIATTASYIFFISFPVKMIMRPDLSYQSGFFVELTKLFYQIDMPYNCFPSLHVTYPTLATLVLWRYYKKTRLVMALMAAIVAVSVIFVKQHYIADVLAGFALASTSYFISCKTERLFGNWFKPLNA